jgi:hypothetical protein
VGTEDRWIACGVRDEIQFGLRPAGELKVETTLCSELWASGQPDEVIHKASCVKHVFINVLRLFFTT